MQQLAIVLDEHKVIGGTQYSAYRCPSCKKKLWLMYWYVDHTCKCGAKLALKYTRK